MKKRKYSSGNIRKEIYDAFQFLVTEHDFTLVDEVDETWVYKLVFKSSTTGVTVTYEFREQYIDIVLYQLVGGEIVKNLMTALSTNERINGFSLEYIIKKTNPKDLVLPVHEYGDDSEFYKDNGFERYLALFVNNLRKYATPLLNGDFSSFEKLDTEFREDYYKNLRK